MYALNPCDLEPSTQGLLALFHLILALGYLFNRHFHAKDGCYKAVD